MTGTVTTSGVTVAIPDITVAKLPMPASSDIDDVRDDVIEQFSDSGLTGTVSVTLISSSSSSIVFNITFNGALTQSGFTFTQGYNITYTYTAN
jgi:hypothetical protein